MQAVADSLELCHCEEHLKSDAYTFTPTGKWASSLIHLPVVKPVSTEMRHGLILNTLTI